MKKLIILLTALIMAFGFALAETDWESVEYYYSFFTDEYREDLAALIDEDGSYDDVISVGIYLFIYERLPDNYITKNEARALGWNGGSLEPYVHNGVIGGDRFGNYEGILPDGYDYTECDIDAMGKKKRGAKRLVFDDEGRIYYTDDHYDSFTLLYEEGMYDAD